MPKGKRQDEIQKAWQKRRVSQKSAGAKPRDAESKRAGAGGRQEQPDSDGSKDTVRILRTPAKDKPVDRSGVSVPNTPEPWVKTTTTITVEKEPFPPKYVHSGPLREFFLKRIGKRIGQYMNRKKEIKPVSDIQPTQQQGDPRFNITTNQMKAIIGVVAMVTTVASGLVGKQILVDEVTITTAVHNLYAAYLGVLSVIAAATWLLRTFKNIQSNWSRIKEHGVKIAGPNADMAFDFAPKDEQQ